MFHKASCFHGLLETHKHNLCRRSIFQQQQQQQPAVPSPFPKTSRPHSFLIDSPSTGSREKLELSLTMLITVGLVCLSQVFVLFCPPPPTPPPRCSWADFFSQVVQSLEPPCTNHPLPHLHFSLCPLFFLRSPSLSFSPCLLQAVSLSCVLGGQRRGSTLRRKSTLPSSSARA